MTTLPFRPPVVNGADAGQASSAFDLEPIGSLPKPKPRKYLMPGRIAFGCFSLIQGRGETLKSHITAALAAAVTGGLRLPGMKRRHDFGGVLIVSSEQHEKRDLEPQLRAAGADVMRVHRIQGGLDRGGAGWDWGGFVLALEALIHKHGVRLVVLDALFDLLPPTIGLSDPRAVRFAVSPLHQVAMQTDAAILGIRHDNKRPNPALRDNGLGSTEFFNIARCVLGTSEITGRPDEYALRSLKHSFGPKAPDLVYRIRVSNGQAIVQFDHEEALSADDLAGSDKDPGEQLHDDLATQVLESFRPQGRVPWRDIVAAARKEAVAEATLRRRSRQMGCSSEREGKGATHCSYLIFPADD